MDVVYIILKHMTSPCIKYEQNRLRVCKYRLRDEFLSACSAHTLYRVQMNSGGGGGGHFSSGSYSVKVCTPT